jgi:hypothetical protein
VDDSWDVTVVVNSSYIPSHPSTEMIRKALSSLRHLQLPNGTPIVIVQDALRKQIASTDDHLRYQRYLDAMSDYASDRDDLKVLQLKRWGHINRALQRVMRRISTRWVLVVQHDFEFVEDVDLGSVLSMMNHNPDVKHLRFNKNPRTVVDWDAELEYRHMVRSRREFVKESVRFGASDKPVPVVRTLAWSDNNYLCSRDYLVNTVFRLTGSLRVPPEHVLNPLGTPKNHGILGTFIYGRLDDPPVIEHLDGRTSLGSDLPAVFPARDAFGHSLGKHILDAWIRLSGRTRMWLLRIVGQRRSD